MRHITALILCGCALVAFKGGSEKAKSAKPPPAPRPAVSLAATFTDVFR